MTISEKLIDYIWNRDYLSDTQKNLLEMNIKSYFENLWSETEAKNTQKEIENEGLLLELEELEEKLEDKEAKIEELTEKMAKFKEEISEIENIVARVVSEVFGLKIKDLVPNDRLKIDKIIGEVKNDG